MSKGAKVLVGEVVVVGAFAGVFVVVGLAGVLLSVPDHGGFDDGVTDLPWNVFWEPVWYDRSAVRRGRATRMLQSHEGQYLSG